MIELSQDIQDRLRAMAQDAENESRVELPGVTPVYETPPEGSAEITTDEFIGDTIRNNWDESTDFGGEMTYFEELQQAVPDAFLVRLYDDKGPIAGFSKAMRPAPAEVEPKHIGRFARIRQALGFKGLES